MGVKLRITIIATLGLALTVYLVAHIGFSIVLSAAVAIGWGGFALVCLCALGVFPILGAAWHALLPPSSLTRMRVVVWARMVRDSAADVLPFSQFGGIVLGARAAILHGVSRPLAFASIIADVTAEMLAQIAYVALGLAVLTLRAPRSSLAGSVTADFTLGLVVAVVAIGLFLALQRHGSRVAGKLAARLLPRAAAATAGVSTALVAIYRAPARVALSSALHFTGWIASGAGAWVAFRLIGVRVDLISVLALESLVYAIRSAAAVVPNALGVQEAAYAMLAPLFGVGAEFALAVSLLKRARDIAVGVPVLLIWQALEGQRVLARRGGGER